MIGAKCIAGADIALFEAAFKPGDALRGTAVRKAVRHHVTLRLFLDAVIPDGAGGIQSFFNIAGFQNISFLVGLMRPHAREAIRLQLQLNV